MNVVFSLGSNLEPRLAHLQTGTDRLARAVDRVRVSPVYETEPVGGPPQGAYLNAVLTGVAGAEVDLLAVALDAERAAGRIRTVRWGPRTLDVDVVAVDGLVRPGPDLILPHPRAHLRAFVLAPWHDLDPAATLPGRGLVGDLLARLDSSGVRRRDDLRLTVAA